MPDSIQPLLGTVLALTALGTLGIGAVVFLVKALLETHRAQVGAMAAVQRLLGEQQEQSSTQHAQLMAGIGEISATLKQASTFVARRLEETSNQVTTVAGELRDAFIQADEGFRHLVDGLQDLANLDEIKHRVDAMSTTLLDTHDKIGSQVQTTGLVVEQLGALVTHWSEEGSALQVQYEQLAGALEEALTRDVQAREQVRDRLETLLAHHARGDGARASQ